MFPKKNLESDPGTTTVYQILGSGSDAISERRMEAGNGEHKNCPADALYRQRFSRSGFDLAFQSSDPNL